MIDTGSTVTAGAGCTAPAAHEGGPGADILSGRATADYHRRTNPVTVTVGDDLSNDGEAGEGGEGGDDTLRGLGGDDYLFGNRGADIFLPGPGNDSVAGGHGPDTIFGRDGQRDSLSGGPGKEDRARVDRGLDKVYDMEELF